MTTINLRPFSQTPLPLAEQTYQQHIAQRDQGWSTCQSEEEWLCKLHYLRQGLLEGKLDKAAFLQREARLVVARIRSLR